MEWLTVLTYLASALLCLYLFIFIAIVGAAMFFLAKGLRWGNEKVSWLLFKVTDVAEKVQEYTRKVMDAVAQPEIQGAAVATAAEVFVKRLFRREPAP